METYTECDILEAYNKAVAVHGKSPRHDPDNILSVYGHMMYFLKNTYVVREEGPGPRPLVWSVAHRNEEPFCFTYSKSAAEIIARRMGAQD